MLWFKSVSLVIAEGKFKSSDLGVPNKTKYIKYLNIQFQYIAIFNKFNHVGTIHVSCFFITRVI